jgi:hypothetical protein
MNFRRIDKRLACTGATSIAGSADDLACLAASTAAAMPPLGTVFRIGKLGNTLLEPLNAPKEDDCAVRNFGTVLRLIITVVGCFRGR